MVKFGREQNNYLPKVGKLHTYGNKTLDSFKEIKSDTGFFLPKEHALRGLKTVHSQFYCTLKLGWVYFVHVPLPKCFCNASFHSTALFEEKVIIVNCSHIKIFGLI